jgi:hypothetical protein
MPGSINTANERPLHAALKQWYARPGDAIEAQVDGFMIDIVRDGLLIEIQTRNFSALKRKLRKLSENHPVRLVYPIPKQKWLVRMDSDGSMLGRRKSPKSGSIDMLFHELVSIPDLLAHPNISIEVLFIQEEEVRRKRARPRWRRVWNTQERRLKEVVGRRLFEDAQSMLEFIPAELNEPFTARELGIAAGKPVWLAQKIVYCLSRMGALEFRGKRRNAHLSARAL